jgi:hypothetical protein
MHTLLDDCGIHCCGFTRCGALRFIAAPRLQRGMHQVSESHGIKLHRAIISAVKQKSRISLQLEERWAFQEIAKRCHAH